MDQIRQIRYVTPPFFFLGSLLLGVWLNNPSWLDTIEELRIPVIATIGGVVVASLLPIGFVITAISTLVLRFGSWLLSCHYQISLSDDAWRRIWPTLKLQTGAEPDKSKELYAAITFDHEILHERINASNVRLWSAFNISVNSSTALVLSHIVGYKLHIPLDYGWVGTTLCLLALFIPTAVITWHEHMGMLEFQSKRIQQNGYMPHHNTKG